MVKAGWTVLGLLGAAVTLVLFAPISICTGRGASERNAAGALRSGGRRPTSKRGIWTPPGCTAFPKAGYWYRSLRFAGEARPDPDRFAVCAFPDRPKVSRVMFLITHKGFVYSKSGPPPLDCSENPEKDGWGRME